MLQIVSLSHSETCNARVSISRAVRLCNCRTGTHITGPGARASTCSLCVRGEFVLCSRCVRRRVYKVSALNTHSQEELKSAPYSMLDGMQKLCNVWMQRTTIWSVIEHRCSRERVRCVRAVFAVFACNSAALQRVREHVFAVFAVNTCSRALGPLQCSQLN